MERKPFSFSLNGLPLGSEANEATTFGEKIKIDVNDLMKTSVLGLLGDGIMDFHGHIIPTKVSNDKHKRRLWKYIQYLWIWNSTHDAFIPLTKADGTGDAMSFANGIRKVLMIDDCGAITLAHLLEFINVFAIDAGGIAHPVLEEMYENIIELAPTWIMQPRVVMEDPNIPGNYVDLVSHVEKEDGAQPVLKVKF